MCKLQQEAWIQNKQKQQHCELGAMYSTEMPLFSTFKELRFKLVETRNFEGYVEVEVEIGGGSESVKE